MAASQAILYFERYLLREAQTDLVGEAGRFAEVDEVFQGEGEGDGFREVDGDVLVWLFDIAVLAEGYGAAADVTLAGEFHAVLGGFDHDYQGEMVR